SAEVAKLLDLSDLLLGTTLSRDREQCRLIVVEPGVLGGLLGLRRNDGDLLRATDGVLRQSEIARSPPDPLVGRLRSAWCRNLRHLRLLRDELGPFGNLVGALKHGELSAMQVLADLDQATVDLILGHEYRIDEVPFERECGFNPMAAGDQ